MMALLGLKRKGKDFATRDRKRNGSRLNEPQDVEREGMVDGTTFEILKLPFELICNILSRLPLNTIFCCRSVCKKLLELLTDPYFAKVHLDIAPSTTASLILQSCFGKKGFLYFYTIDLDETASCAISDSTSAYKLLPPGRTHHKLSKQNAEFFFRSSRQASFVGSCNGLLCLYSSLPQPLYYVCNPILGESVILPPPTQMAPGYTHYLSGFGFCPETKEYKVVRFMYLASVDKNITSVSEQTVAEIYTLGSDSWRRIGEAPRPKRGGSFDPFLNGALHWIIETTEQVCSLDLNTEQFGILQSPPHFQPHYMKKVSWINIGTLGGYLCLCYIYEDACLEAWVMKDYGVKESWSREFSIDINFYCGLKVENLRQPVKFLNNGDLWLMCNSRSLASYSPRKGTFRDFKALSKWKSEVIALVPSFISLKHAMSSKNLSVETLTRKRPKTLKPCVAPQTLEVSVTYG